MAKGSGAGGGQKTSGGVGGRSAAGAAQSLKTARLAIGALYAVSGATLYLQLRDPVFREIYKDIFTQATGTSPEVLAQEILNSTAHVTKGMRDKVRSYAKRKAGEAATKAARAKNPGAIDVSGISLDGVRGALGSGSARARKGAASNWRKIPDNSVIGFSKTSKGFSGKDVKSLIRDGISAAKAGRSDVANPPPGQYESAARRIDLGAVKGRGPKRKRT